MIEKEWTMASGVESARYCEETVLRDGCPTMCGRPLDARLRCSYWRDHLSEKQFPASHDTYQHREDGRVCVLVEDGTWFVPYDVGGEGFTCERSHSSPKVRQWVLDVFYDPTDFVVDDGEVIRLLNIIEPGWRNLLREERVERGRDNG